MSEGFPRSLRLRRRGEYLRVQRAGRKLHTRHFLVFVAPQQIDDAPAGPSRVGITVTRKVAGSVGRNRIRRRVREAFRRSHAELPLGLELVIVAKHDALQASWLEIFEEISGTARSLARAEAPL